MSTHENDGLRRRPLTVALRTGAVALFVVGLAVTVAFVDWVGLVIFVAYAGVGAFLAFRRPTNSIGWLLIVAGFGLTFGTAMVTASQGDVLAGTLEPIDAATAWLNGAGWGFAFDALFVLALVFPSGTLGRERRLSWLALAAMVLITATVAVSPSLGVAVAPSGRQMQTPNPLAMLPGAAIWELVPPPDVLYPIALVIFVAGLIGLYRRYRAATGLPRLQYRWLVAAIGLVAVGTMSWAILTLAVGAYAMAMLAYVLTYPAVPVAVMIAVLRYRLFEIDRIISRTVAYGVVTATLALVFVGVVLGLQAALERFVGGSTIAVAASTLIVAALFQPLRRRVQRIVDRRFNRARYDAQRTAEAFAGQLRMETDMETLVGDLTAVVEEALAPQSAGLWVRENEAAR